LKPKPEQAADGDAIRRKALDLLARREHSRRELARKLAAILVAAAAAFVALLMICVWLLALAWDGPWRNWVAGGLALGFAVAAAALALPVLRPRGGPPEFFARTRTELGRDRELLERAFDRRNRRARSGDDDHAAR